MHASRHDPGKGVPHIAPDYFNHVVAHLPARKTATDLGDWFLRVVHLPESRPETVWDVHFEQGVAQLQLICFQESARKALEVSTSMVPTERGVASLPENEALVKEIQKGLCLECRNFEDEKPDGDIYVLFFQHGKETHKAFARNPRYSEMDTAEHWQRLLNRLTGSALLVQRSIHLG